jgi:nitrite reductase (NO-forming)
VSECATDAQLRQQIKPLPWIEQVPVMIIIAALLAFLISGSTSSITVGMTQTLGPLENVYMHPSMYDYPGSSGAPMSAADHMSNPLNVAGQSAVEFANPAVLPPLIGTGKTVDVHMDATDQTVEIAGGINYQAWTFNKTVPGPIIHVRQGQTVNITLTNHSRMPHSLDLHEAEVAPNVNYANINFGETLHATFVAKVPGAFLYHCGTPPVLWHMANGMYGVIVVDPKVPLPHADKSYVLIQSEWYTRQLHGATYTGEFSKMLARTPDLVVFNGKAFQYKANPLPASAGKLVRIYFVNAGPDMWSSFHVIGGIFKKVYPGGDRNEAITGVSTYSVSPGAGAIFDIVMPTPGHYAFVDHDMSSMSKGAVGVFDVQ